MPAINKTVATFSPALAKDIRDYVRENMPKVPGARANTIAGRTVITKKLFAKITGSATSGGVVGHSWTEQFWDYPHKQFIDASDAKTGTTTENYIVVVPDTSTELATGTIVEATLVSYPDTGESVYLTSSIASLPSGEFAEMVYKNVTNNTSGWGFVRLHPPLT